MRRAATIAAVACAACGRLGFDQVIDSAATVDVAFMDAPPNMTAELCPPIPMPATAVRVDTVTALRTALMTAAAGTTILLADGTYPIANTLVIDRAVTVRSESGNASRVILDGMSSAVPVVYLIASDARLVSLTIANGAGEGVHVTPMAGTDITTMAIYDVTLKDHALPYVRVRPTSGNFTGPFADYSTIACSRFIATTAATGCGGATGAWAINIDAARGWNIHHNLFDQRACPIGGSRTVWVDTGSRDTTVVANTFLDTNLGIMFGGGTGGRAYLGPVPSGCSGTIDHWGGLICNNVIASLSPAPQPSDPDFEEGIALWNACDSYVMHNTIVSEVGAETFTNLEYRFAGTYVHLINNFSALAPIQREGAVENPAFAASNRLFPSATVFANATNGDASPAPGKTFPTGADIAFTTSCVSDIRGTPRNLALPTVGAFEP